METGSQGIFLLTCEANGSQRCTDIIVIPTDLPDKMKREVLIVLWLFTVVGQCSQLFDNGQQVLEFNTPTFYESPQEFKTITAEVVSVQPARACEAILNPIEIAGKIALVEKGSN